MTFKKSFYHFKQYKYQREQIIFLNVKLYIRRWKRKAVNSILTVLHSESPLENNRDSELIKSSLNSLSCQIEFDYQYPTRIAHKFN